MKAFVCVLFVVACSLFSSANAGLSCNTADEDMPKDFKTMQKGCIKEVKRQVQMEIDASMFYLSMAAYFSKDTVNRPGFANLFFQSAAEEREHGHKLIEYLSMRGQLLENTRDIATLIRTYPPGKDTWSSGLEALRDALQKETEVTASIRRVISTCEDDERFNDFHLVDYLTGEYLEEQYKGQRELAGKISTLGKMQNQGPIGEFLFDKTLL